MAFSASFFLMLMTGRVFQKRLGRAVLDHAVGVSLFIADAAAEPGRSAALALLFAVGGDHSVKRPLPFSLQKFFGYAAVQEIPGENLVKTPLPTPMWTVGSSSMPRSALLRWSIRSGLPARSR